MPNIGAQRIQKQQPRLRLVRRIITGEITIAAGATSGTATIAATNSRYAMLIYGGFRTAQNAAFDASKQYIRISQTNATTITAQTNTADASFTRTARYTIVEFYPWAVRSVQSGTILLNGVTSATATINAVNTSNAFVLFQGQTHSTNTDTWNYILGRVSLTNSTTVTAEKNSGAINALTVGYSVIEFNPGILKSVQQQSATIAAGTASITATITAVDTSNSILLYNGQNIDLFGASNTQYLTRMTLTNSTTVTYTRISTGAVSCPVRSTVIEFHPIYIRQKQSGTTAIGNGATSNTSSITASDTLKTIALWDGLTDSANSTANPSICYSTIEHTSPTVITAKRDVSSTNTITVAWEAIEFR